MSCTVCTREFSRHTQRTRANRHVWLTKEKRKHVDTLSNCLTNLGWSQGCQTLLMKNVICLLSFDQQCRQSLIRRYWLNIHIVLWFWSCCFFWCVVCLSPSSVFCSLTEHVFGRGCSSQLQINSSISLHKLSPPSTTSDTTSTVSFSASSVRCFLDIIVSLLPSSEVMCALSSFVSSPEFSHALGPR